MHVLRRDAENHSRGRSCLQVLIRRLACLEPNPYIACMAVVHTIVLLTISNVFMTFAWYAHLRDLREKPWIIAALVSWGIAAFEYLVQVPANRIGYQVMNLGQLKILQEVITLTVFVPFAVFFMKEKLTWNYLGAALCLAGAVFFIFRK
jgi:uncharacterized protein